MRIGYLHCFSGISGDMFLGALVDAGVPYKFLRETAQSLQLGVDLTIERVNRSGLSSIKVHVLEAGSREAQGENVFSGDDGKIAPTHRQAHMESHSHSHEDGHGHSHEHSHSHTHEHGEDASHGHSHSPPEEGAQSHSHVQSHSHGRSLSSIRTLIEQAPLTPDVKRTAIRAFEMLGASEAKMHNVPIEQVHFHEVGAVDAIIDIVCGCAGALSLGVDRWVCSPLNVGSGMVRCAHGVFPVPAPATLDLLQGVPIYSEGPEGERVTPTGAALIRALGCTFGPMPRMLAGHTGYGAGTRNPPDHPNVLRLILSETTTFQSKHFSIESDGMGNGEAIAVLETAIDDSTPQVIGFVMEEALAAGALDVMTTPVMMKKNRPGTLITILCVPEETTRFCELLFRQTSTIGVRTRLDQRQCLPREIVTVDTEWGEVRLKIARLEGTIVNAAPEFEDCRRLAQMHNIPLKEIQAAAVAEYTRTAVDGAIANLPSGVSTRT